MKIDILGSKYHDDAVVAAMMVLIAVTSATFCSYAFLIGALVGILPHLITTYYSDGSRTPSERARAAVLFVVFFFLGIWSTDLTASDAQRFITTALFSAAIYHFVLWAVIKNPGRQREAKLTRSKQLWFGIGFIMLLWVRIFVNRIEQGLTAGIATSVARILAIFMISYLLQVDRKRTA